MCLSSAGRTFLFSAASEYYLSFGVKDETLCFESNENITTGWLVGASMHFYINYYELEAWPRTSISKGLARITLHSDNSLSQAAIHQKAGFFHSSIFL